MSRPRSQTIGTLGRTPARQSARMPAVVPPPIQPPPSSDGGGIKRWLRAALFDNMGLKFLSVVLAVTVFLLVNADKDREITVRVGVKYDYPTDKVLITNKLEVVDVTVKGPWRVLRKFDERELNRIVLDLKTAPSGEIAITPDLITNLPARLTVTSISPRSVKVGFESLVEKLVEIEVETSTPEYGYQVVDRRATERCKVAPCAPAGTVRLRGNKTLLDALTSVRTTEVKIEGHDPIDTQADLVLPPGVQADATNVNVHLAFDEVRVQRKYEREVTIRAEGVAGDPTTRWTLEPAQIEVTYQGTLKAVEQAAKEPVIVKATAADLGRVRDAEVILENVPKIVGKELSTDRVKLVPIKAAPPPTPAPQAPQQP